MDPDRRAPRLYPRTVQVLKNFGTNPLMHSLQHTFELNPEWALPDHAPIQFLPNRRGSLQPFTSFPGP